MLVSPGCSTSGPIFSIARSAWSLVATVVDSEAELLAGTGSTCAAETVATFWNSPVVVAAATTVTAAVADGASVPRLQVALAHVPCVDAADTNDRPAGSVSTRDTL